MKERPILFSGPMVRAILAGQKTQTRRAIRNQPMYPVYVATDPSTPRFIQDGREPVALSTFLLRCPYGQPGDVLWVRESTVRVEEHGYDGPVYVESDDGRACLDGGLTPDPDDCTEVEPYELRIRPSIFMPRAYCRIRMTITDVRVERLNDISEADAEAEGADELITDNCSQIERTLLDMPLMESGHPFRNGFALLWEAINGDGSWTANPWVWVVEFRRIDS